MHFCVLLHPETFQHLSAVSQGEMVSVTMLNGKDIMRIVKCISNVSISLKSANYFLYNLGFILSSLKRCYLHDLWYSSYDCMKRLLRSLSDRWEYLNAIECFSLDEGFVFLKLRGVNLTR